MKNNKAFTLIELLVVIAIIAILAAIVLVSLGGAQRRARAARITSTMQQIRNEAEIFKSQSPTNVYTGFTPSASLTTDITGQGGRNYGLNISGANYCAEVQMPTGDDNWWCIDGNLISKSYPAASPPICSTTVFTCE